MSFLSIARTALEAEHHDLTAKVDAIENEVTNLQRRPPTPEEAAEMLEFSYEARGVRNSLVLLNGLAANMPIGARVGYSSLRMDPSAQGTVVHPREATLESEDDIELQHVHDDWAEMLVVRWDHNSTEPTWEYISALRIAR